jgi:hypothetical protein
MDVHTAQPTRRAPAPPAPPAPPTSQTAPDASRRRFTVRAVLTVPAVTGIAYTVSWIAGLSVPAPSPSLNASGEAIVAALAGHGSAVAANYALTEGLPAIGLAIIGLLLARAARRPAAPAADRPGRIAGIVGVAAVTAALISLTQFILGLVLAGTSAPATAYGLYDAVNRLDGVKMLVLAVFAAAAVATGLLPRWLRYTGIALAVALVASGIPYLLLLQGPSVLAYVSGPLLLAFVTGTGITLGMAGR